jgi:hypothetical protein
MRRSRLVFAAMFVICAAGAATAQSVDDAMSPLAVSVACAPPPSTGEMPEHALRVIGSQDAVPRALLGNRDLLVIGGGTAAGVQLGQQFFIRRTNTFGGNRYARGARTLGWVRVVAVNDSTAIGLVDHACAGIVVSDYLEPFVVPVLSADAVKDDPSGQPDFSTLGHIVAGNEDRMTVGVGDFALIDWGQDRGLNAGARFSIYRDVGVSGLPLASIGEGVVISIGSSMALTRITSARDAVYSGDYIAMRK